MEGVRNEVLQQFDQLSIDDDNNSEYKLVFEGAFVRLRNEFEKLKQENDLSKSRSENLIQKFEEKLVEIQNDLLEFELFSDIGICALVEAIQWFRKSIEHYEQKRRSLNRIERVQIDASRLLSTVHNQIRSKIQICNFDGNEYDEFQNLAKVLEDSIHIMNSKISTCSQNVVNINNNEMNENMVEVGNNADSLLVFLKNIQEQQTKKIDSKLTFDTSEENLKVITERTESKNAIEVEKEVGKSVEKFVKANRNKDSLTMEDVRRIIVEVNKLWKKSKTSRKTSEVGKHREDLKNMFAEFEKQLEEWNIQRRPKPEENRKINEWKEPCLSVPESSNSSKFNGIIKKSFVNFLDLDENGETSENMKIGDIEWICHIYSQLPGHLSCVVVGSFGDFYWKWGCTAIIDFRIMNLSKTETFFSAGRLMNFDSETKATVFSMIDVLNLMENEDHTSIETELEVTVLRQTGIPRPESSLKNSDYELITGIVDHTFTGISHLEMEQSTSVDIGNVNCHMKMLRMGDSALIAIHCDDLHSFCLVEVEVRLLKRSGSDEFHSKSEFQRTDQENTVVLFHDFIDWDDLIDPQNNYIEDDNIRIVTIINIFVRH